MLACFPFRSNSLDEVLTKLCCGCHEYQFLAWFYREKKHWRSANSAWWSKTARPRCRSTRHCTWRSPFPPKCLQVGQTTTRTRYVTSAGYVSVRLFHYPVGILKTYFHIIPGRCRTQISIRSKWCTELYPVRCILYDFFVWQIGLNTLRTRSGWPSTALSWGVSCSIAFSSAENWWRNTQRCLSIIFKVTFDSRPLQQFPGDMECDLLILFV